MLQSADNPTQIAAETMGQPALSGSEAELHSITEWLHVIATLRHRLLDEPATDFDVERRIHLLVLRLSQAEGRLQATVGLPLLP